MLGGRNHKVHLKSLRCYVQHRHERGTKGFPETNLGSKNRINDDISRQDKARNKNEAHDQREVAPNAEKSLFLVVIE